MSVSLWKQGNEITSSEIPIYCKPQDEAAVKAAIESSCWRPAVFSVTPNAEDLLPFIAVNEHWKLHNASAQLGSSYQSGCEAIAFGALTSIIAICHNFRFFNAEGAIAACHDLSSFLAAGTRNNPRCIPAQLVTVNAFLLDFSIECLLPLEFGSPFIHGSPQDHHRRWWTTQAGHVTKLQQFGKRLKVDFSQNPPIGLSALEIWRSDVEMRLRRMQASPPNDATRKRALLEASSYCSALAERHLIRGHFSLAILLLHRALDLVMFSLCVHWNAIDFAYRGGQYISTFSPSGKPNQISLLNSLSAIGNQFASHPTREADFKELNDWRNLLLQTHYMSGLDDVKARSIFTKIRPHLEALGGSDWQASLNRYLGGIYLNVSHIFDADSYLSNSVTRLSY